MDECPECGLDKIDNCILEFPDTDEKYVGYWCHGCETFIDPADLEKELVEE